MPLGLKVHRRWSQILNTSFPCFETLHTCCMSSLVGSERGHKFHNMSDVTPVCTTGNCISQVVIRVKRSVFLLMRMKKHNHSFLVRVAFLRFPSAPRGRVPGVSLEAQPACLRRCCSTPATLPNRTGAFHVCQLLQKFASTLPASMTRSLAADAAAPKRFVGGLGSTEGDVMGNPAASSCNTKHR